MSTVSKAAQEDDLDDAGYEIFIGALSLLSLVNIVLITALRDEATRNVVAVMDLVFTIVFLGDFVVRLWRSESKAHYFFREFGWADLLASLPFPQAKVLRVFRLLRVSRVLRRYGAKAIARNLLSNRAGSALLSLLFIGVLVLEFGSLSILALERDHPDANIRSAADAIWYVIVTMSTVGYGDRFPVTTAGRELGTFIIIVGVGIFGTLTGFLANLFLEPPAGEVDEAQTADLPEKTTTNESDVHAEFARLQDLINQQQAVVARLVESLPRSS